MTTAIFVIFNLFPLKKKRGLPHPPFGLLDRYHYSIFDYHRGIPRMGLGVVRPLDASSPIGGGGKRTRGEYRHGLSCFDRFLESFLRFEIRRHVHCTILSFRVLFPSYAIIISQLSAMSSDKMINSENNSNRIGKLGRCRQFDYTSPIRV